MRLWLGAAAAILVFLAVLEVAARTTWSFARSAGFLVLVLGAALIAARLLGFDRGGRLRRSLLGLSPAELDRLDGRAFEEWVAAVLREAGWTVEPTPRGSDYGVDLVAGREGVRVGIEAKRRTRRIDNAAVRSVVAGCQFHGCDAAAVVTQSSFTRHARRQAEAAQIPIALVGRDELSALASRLDALIS